MLEKSKEIHERVSFLVKCVSWNVFSFNFQPRFHVQFIFTVKRLNPGVISKVVQVEFDRPGEHSAE